jgi:hypothetical protein
VSVLATAKSLEAKLTETNEARRELGLPLLSAKVRKCLQCGEQFASIEARTCTPCLKKRDSE